MKNTHALYSNINNPIVLELVYTVSDYIISKASFTGILKAKPPGPDVSIPHIYGLKHKSGFVTLDTKPAINSFTVLQDDSGAIMKLTVTFWRS